MSFVAIIVFFLVLCALVLLLVKRKTQPYRTNCIFCNNPLDGSDEHVIPDSLNGRLHSKNVICSECNSKFGRFIDPVFKEQLNPMLIAFGFKNASHTQAEGLDGDKYKYSKTGEASPIKDDVSITKTNIGTILKIQGGVESALKAIKRQAEKLEKKGLKLTALTKAEIVSEHNLLRIKFDLKFSPKLALGLSKIATEYYALNGLNTDLIKELLDKVNVLNEDIDAVTLCNWNGSIREYDLEEISHLIVLRTDSTKILYCYIELFNTVCACIRLCENYPLPVDKVYYQNAITGERINRDVSLKYNPLDEPNGDENFEILINSVFDRLTNIEFNKILQAETIKIMEQYTAEQSQGVTHKEHDLEERLGKMAAELSMAFPYLIEDFKDEENEQVNHINSNLIEEQYDEFCKKNSGWLGKDIEIDKEHYKFDSFVKSPFLKRNNISLIKIHFKLINKTTAKSRFFPYAEFFRMVNQAYPEAGKGKKGE